MKTLKKTLCLVLAVVMAVGVLILPANADKATYDGFDDTDDLGDYELAVATLTGMGIISGKSDTTFAPKAAVNRAEAATLISVALTTPAGHDLAVLGSKHPFTDVTSAWSWASSNIGYLYELGVVSGKTDTTFAPGATVTGYELATMLMKATGYEPSDENLSWTAKAAEFCGVYDIFEYGLKDVFTDMNKALTREETAQMIWMAITHTDDDSKTYDVYKITGTLPKEGEEPTPANLVLCEDNATLERLVYWRAALGERLWFTIDELGGTIAEKVHHLEKDTSADIYGRPTIIYSNYDTDEVYSTTAIQPVATYENKSVTLGKIFGEDLKAIKTNKSIDILTYVDGVRAPVSGVKKDNKVAYGGYGSQIFVYKDGEEYTLVEINPFAVELKDTMYVKAKKDVPAHWVVPKADITGVDCKTVATGGSVSIDQNGYKAGDVLLFNIGHTTEKDKNGDEVDVAVVEDYEKITAVESNIIRKSNKSDNVQYIRLASEGNDNLYFVKFYNDTKKDFNSLKTSVSATEMVLAYFDTYGNIVYITSENAEKIAGEYVYVLEYQAKYTTTDSGEDLYDEWNNQSDDWPTSAKARILDLTTGKVSVVWVDTTVSGDITWYVDFDGSIKAGNAVQYVPYIGYDVTTATTAPKGWKDPTGSNPDFNKYVEYCKNYYLGYHKVLREVDEASDGTEVVRLRPLEATSAKDVDFYNRPNNDVFKLEGANVTVQTGNDPYRVATNATVLHVITKDGTKKNTYTITSKTGYKNFKAEDLENLKNALVTYTNKNEYVVADIYVFGNYKGSAPVASAQNYYIYTGRDDIVLDDDGVTRVWQYSFYLNGEEVFLKSKTEQPDLQKETSAGGVFILKLDSKGYIVANNDADNTKDGVQPAVAVVNKSVAVPDNADGNVFEVREVEAGQFVAVGEDNIVYLLSEVYAVYDSTEDGDGVDGVVEVGDLVMLYAADPSKSTVPGCECNLVYIVEKNYEE